MCDIALVLGRHIREPYIEGGGKITYILARALNEIGIQTYLIKVNYSLPWDGFYVIRTHTDHSKGSCEWELRLGLLKQDDILHRMSGVVISNLIELVVNPLIALKLIKAVTNANKRVCIFIGNSSKLGGLFVTNIYKLLAERTVKTLTIYRREEILRLTSHVVRPEAIFTTSRELLILSHKLLGNIVEKIIFSYPPILPEERPSDLPSQKLPILLYMGRLTNQRFPLHVLKDLIISLKKTSKDTRLVIVAPPESVSIMWLTSARELIMKLDAKDKVMFILKTLDNEEKRSVLAKASIFIFPSRGVAAVEPPLSVIESLTYGQYLITTGNNSTRELVYSGAGLITEDFDKLDIEECFMISNRLCRKIFMWARETFSFHKLVDSLKEVLF